MPANEHELRAAIIAELKRIGVDSDRIPVFAAAGTDLRGLLDVLRGLRSDAGVEELEHALESSGIGTLPMWHHWPSPGDTFSRDDYVQAFALINGCPEEIVHEMVMPPPSLSNDVLALLALVSEEHFHRVHAFRMAVNIARRQSGVSRGHRDVRPHIC